MAATALIVFDQGGPGTPGEAFEGTTASLVTVTNDDNTDVASWTITLTDVPPDSALVPGVLGTAADANPTASFTPDVPGSYRIELAVTDGVTPDSDIRIFGVRNARGFIFPAYGDLPSPKPVLGSGEPGEKPDEYNFGGQSRGWAGDRASGLLEEFMTKYADLPSTVRMATPITQAVESEPLQIVDTDTIAGVSVFNLPLNARANYVTHVMATGTTPANIVTVQPQGGGSILGFGSSVVLAPPFGSVTFVCLGSNNWRVLGAKSDTYERSIVSGVESTDQTGFVSVGLAPLDLSNFVNIQSITLQVVLETTNVADPAEIRLFNLTTAAVVASSTLQSTSLTPELLTADVTASLAAGANLYEAQLRLVNTGSPNRASCKQAQLLIDWVQT